VALDEFLRPWSGVAYRHIPADSPYGVLDFRFAGRGRDNRWNDPGDRTLYLAGDHGVILAEFARHLQIDRGNDARIVTQVRQICWIDIALEHVLDLRDPAVWQTLSLTGAPSAFLDKSVTRATARYLRTVTPAQAIIVPSAPFIDAPDRWVLVLFLEKVSPDPSHFIRSAKPDGIVRIEP
jgi:RES domain-containing protein